MTVDTHETFGRIINRAGAAGELLRAEAERGKACAQFAEVDQLVGRLLVRSLRGERVIELRQDDLRAYHLSITGLDAGERQTVDTWFAVEKQEARGNWSIPDKASLRAGHSNLLWSYNQWGRFGTALAEEDRGPVKLKGAPDAVFHWAILEDLFNTLTLPLQLRGALAGERTREEQLEIWAVADAIYSSLGFNLREELSALRYGGGWHRRNSSDQLDAKLRLLTALGEQAKIEMGALYRAHRTLALVSAYYKKAKGDGRAKRKQVVTKDLERAFCAHWGGDWLLFLSYLGEEPHPDEQVVTALPKVKPLVSQSARIEEIAESQNLPPEVIKSIASSYWQDTGGASPVELRVECLKKFWHAFDEFHARQTTKMKPPWGLVREARHEVVAQWEGRELLRPDLYREVLPGSLLSEIRGLWSGAMLPRWPDRIVTEPFPYQAMIETFGPALKFWDGCSLTAWFICEGPSSTTDMAGLAHYLRREVAALDEAGTPVDLRLFEDLIEAEKHLGPPEEIRNETSSKDYGLFSVSISVGGSTRRRGFRSLRDLITGHRRSWAQKHLDGYIKARWEIEIMEAAKKYNLLTQGRDGRGPRLKQFAKIAAPATNHWFGGDVCGLFGAIREKCPEQAVRVNLMPEDVPGFARALFAALTAHAARLRGEDEARRYRNYIEVLTNLGIKYVQLEEAYGRPPLMKEMGRTFDFHSIAIAEGADEGWRLFVAAIGESRPVRSNQA